MALGKSQVQDFMGRLASIREQHFGARSREEKRKLRDKDAALRSELANTLESLNFGHDDAQRVSDWDLYDQNACANWFDPGWMFGATEGFDVIIGNPPYIQLQKDRGRLGQRYKCAGFKTFARTGDIYQLFYEKGCQMLSPKSGLLAFITSNSWLKAEYGKGTRLWLSEKHSPLRLLEVGKDVFKNAIVDTCILVVRNGESEFSCRALDMDNLPDGNFPPDDKLWGDLYARGDGPWAALSPIESRIMEKMQSVGTPLKEWDISIYRGVLTGYNDAFIIDESIRQSLITEDAKSVDLLKPVLRGRDIRRYQAQWDGLWLIDTHNGYNDAPPIDAQKYPAIKRHLAHFYPKLEKRQDKGITPYNLRNCAYHAEFAKEKLVWIELVEKGRFAYDTTGKYAEASAFFMVGESLKYLCGLMNTKLVHWFLRQIAPTSGMGTLRWKKAYIETIPIPRIDEQKQFSVIKLVNQILSFKAKDEEANIALLEANVEQLVYGLYGLDREEIEALDVRKVL